MSFNKRLVQIDLDQHVGKDSKVLQDYLDQCLESIDANIVCLQVAMETNEGNKVANTLLFKPAIDFAIKIISGTIYKEAAAYIRQKRPHCCILAWAPSLYCSFLTLKEDKGKTKVEIVPGHEDERDGLDFLRGSPFLALTRERLKAFYRALGACSKDIDGVLFQDDLHLLDSEDNSLAGREAIRNICGVESYDDITKVMTEQGDEYKGEFPEKQQAAFSLY